jgi:hydrogenase/urease accessory protein HupE
MAEAVYLLCLATSVGCAGALLRSYVQRRTRLLLWSSLCFIGLAVNNALLFLDLIVLPNVDLSIPRSLVGALATLMLVVGLTWDAD